MQKLISFLDKLEASKKTGIFVGAVVGCSLFVLQTEGAESLGFIEIPKRYIFILDQILVISWVLIFSLECTYILLGHRLRSITKFLKTILNRITAVMNSLFLTVLVRPLTFLIRPSVKMILKESELFSTRRKFLFINQKVGQRDDDHYFPEVFDLNELIKVKITPKGIGTASNRWRFGFKFSNDMYFPDARYDRDHPLFHLTKDQTETKLKTHYYREGDSKETVHELWDIYNNEPITIELHNGEKNTSIAITPTQDGGTWNLLFGERWCYCQILAWADGESTFQIDAEIERISIHKTSPSSNTRKR